MKNLFVNYKLSLLLKENGFNENCLGFYGDDGKLYFDSPLSNFLDGINPLYCAAPLYQQAIDWLLKKLDFNYPYLKIEIFSDGSGTWFHPTDKDIEKLEIDFDNLKEAIEKALTLI